MLVALPVWVVAGCAARDLAADVDPARWTVAPPAELVPARVVRAVDGDTLVVAFKAGARVERRGERLFLSLAGERVEVAPEERVRLIGVNAPEIAHDSRPAEYFGREAADFTRQRLHGREVHLAFDVQKRDQYGRLLAYVFDGERLFNAELVARGYAQVMTVPPNVSYADLFLALQREARAAGRGLWGKP
ncbi:MAG: thermonuclease family protein [Desulfotomaculales bacterium]